MTRKDYRAERITVSFYLERCVHSEECIHGLPEGFSTRRNALGFNPTRRSSQYQRPVSARK